MSKKLFHLMEKITLLTRLSFIMFKYFILIASLLIANTSLALDLPVIKRSGVLPIEWINAQSLSQNQKVKAQYISDNFRKIIYSSKRFRFANDEIVDLYAFSNSGRNTLEKQYEVNSLIGMNATVKNDLVEFQVFLSSLELDLYLAETKRININWLEKASNDEILRENN